ncbi:type II secretion system F family protein [Ochrobactrum sp. Marseille-Q0166]|uniref:type II secretion system F family protein n=1 Tax=Ochrobactrum sp. Marseille-Q0166 TaxID=2761105 RepID=UPI001655F1CF|nr:type II secretion system F family protein [Ochrobactrum sp. Marseille-Q0166]MBC8719077.1 type II secretion system F family protein [Ochrobactrum sp. Marseille-Q0166]
MYFSLFVSITMLSIFILYPYLNIDKKLNELNPRRTRKKNNINYELLYPKNVNIINKFIAGDAVKISTKLKSAGLYDLNLINRFIKYKFILFFITILSILTFAFIIDKRDLLYFTLKIIAISSFLLLVYLSPDLYLKNKSIKRKANIKKYWSDALDLMLVCVESGSTIEYSLIKVISNIKYVCEEISSELEYTVKELNLLNDRREAFLNLAKRTGVDSIETFVQCVVQAERYGTPISQALRVLAQEHREQRMQLAERKAAALPPKLTVPMILFFLPVIFAVILTPAIIQVSAQGGIMGGN